MPEPQSDDQGDINPAYADGSWPIEDNASFRDPVANAGQAWAYLHRAYGQPEPDGSEA